MTKEDLDILAQPFSHHDVEGCRVCLIRRVAGSGPCEDGRRAVRHYDLLTIKVPQLVRKVRRLQGEYTKLMQVNMDLAKMYADMMIAADGLAEALKLVPDTHDPHCVVVRNVYGHDLECTCSRSKALAAIAEHETLTDPTK